MTTAVERHLVEAGHELLDAGHGTAVARRRPWGRRRGRRRSCRSRDRVVLDRHRCLDRRQQGRRCSCRAVHRCRNRPWRPTLERRQRAGAGAPADLGSSGARDRRRLPRHRPRRQRGRQHRPHSLMRRSLASGVRSLSFPDGMRCPRRCAAVEFGMRGRRHGLRKGHRPRRWRRSLRGHRLLPPTRRPPSSPPLCRRCPRRSTHCRRSRRRPRRWWTVATVLADITMTSVPSDVIVPTSDASLDEVTNPINGRRGGRRPLPGRARLRGRDDRDLPDRHARHPRFRRHQRVER